jgi:folate-dependent phosphoribosylglycinamide formyltransferase PurN
MIWIAFFSQTGSEIVELSKSLGRKPDLIVTNNFEEKIKFNSGVRELDVTIMSAKHDLLMNYFRSQSVYNISQTIISLHGYLRILPPDICEQYEVYNGHPGAINLYPELKGKDPQEKVWLEMEKYNIIGSVVHRCTAELDAGDIMKSVEVSNVNFSRDEVYTSLKMTSLSAWNFFMKEKGICA